MKKLFFIFVFIIAPCFAAQDIYQFNNEEQEKRFLSLTTQLRCLVCQNQNIAESNAPLAADLRQQIYQKIKSGETDKAITDYLLARYGSYILYQPPFSFFTMALWVGPFLFLLLALFFLLSYIKRGNKS